MQEIMQQLYAAAMAEITELKLAAEKSEQKIVLLRAALVEIRSGLDYSLNRVAEKECDQIIWSANMAAFKLAKQLVEETT